MTDHQLKIYPDYWDEIANGKKTFEVRKNDRGYKLNDRLVFHKYNPGLKEYVDDDDILICRVTYITDLSRIGIEGFVGMQIKVLVARRSPRTGRGI